MNVRFSVDLRGRTGRTAHRIGTIINDAPVPVCRIPAPVTLQISEEGGAFYLLRLDSFGECVADTWHPTVLDAQQQAEFEYGVRSGEWVPAS